MWLLLSLPRPRALRAAQESTRRTVFDEVQWKTVEALTGRIIPTDHEPGAIEANCVNFIDKALAHEDLDYVWYVADNVMIKDRRAWWMDHYLRGTLAVAIT